MSALLCVDFEYEWHKKVKDLDALKLSNPELFKDDGEPAGSWELADRILDSAEVQALTDAGVVLKIKRFKGVIPAGYAKDVPAGSQVHIHLPNYVLTNFNKVELLEDCCTDALQEKLDDGWRIIAICPPLNARRPDYIVAKVV